MSDDECVQDRLDRRVAAQFRAAHVALVRALVRAVGLRQDEPWPLKDGRLAALEADGRIVALTDDGPELAAWFAAFRSFGANPKRLRPSVSALSRRLAKSGALPRINPAVDTYNLISVTHAVPAGAFDLAAVAGDIEIRHARPGDRFLPLGADTAEDVDTAEVVYATGDTVLTRHWNHRDSDLTKVTAESRDVLFLLERTSSDTARVAALDVAVDDLRALLAPHCDDVESRAISAGSPSVTF